MDEHGKIVKHWDILQIIREASANENGMFKQLAHMPSRSRLFSMSAPGAHRQDTSLGEALQAFKSRFGMQDLSAP
jgi:hypothetical protein